MIDNVTKPATDTTIKTLKIATESTVDTVAKQTDCHANGDAHKSAIHISASVNNASKHTRANANANAANVHHDKIDTEANEAVSINDNFDEHNQFDEYNQAREHHKDEMSTQPSIVIESAETGNNAKNSKDADIKNADINDTNANISNNVAPNTTDISNNTTTNQSNGTAEQTDKTAVVDEYVIKEKPSKYANFMRAFKVKTPKYKFYVERGGEVDRPAILLIMGLGAQSLVWPNEFCEKMIEAGFQVIRFDNRDIGKSSKIKHKNKLTKKHQTKLRQLHLMTEFKLGLRLRLPRLSERYHLPIPYDLYDMAEDVNQLLNALQIPACHVLGMSMGGMIAQILAADYPERVISLGLLSTSNNRPLLPPPHISSLRQLARPAPNKANFEARVDYTVDLIKTLSSPNYFDEKSARERAIVMHNRRFYPKGTKRQLLAILSTGSLNKLDARIKQPTLIVHGVKDKLFSAAHARALAKAIPHAHLKLIHELGHDIPEALAGNMSDYFIEHFSQYGVADSELL